MIIKNYKFIKTTPYNHVVIFGTNFIKCNDQVVEYELDIECIVDNNINMFLSFKKFGQIDSKIEYVFDELINYSKIIEEYIKIKENAVCYDKKLRIFGYEFTLASIEIK